MHLTWYISIHFISSVIEDKYYILNIRHLRLHHILNLVHHDVLYIICWCGIKIVNLSLRIIQSINL